MSDDGYRFLAKVADVPPGGMRSFEVAGVDVLLCHSKTDGAFYAVENLCSHALSTFDEGRLRGFRLMCPVHGASFDIRDGKVLGAPAYEPIKAFPVRVRGDDVEVSVEQGTETAPPRSPLA